MALDGVEAAITVRRELKEKQRDISQKLQQMQSHAAEAANLMKALGNESRLMILCALVEAERSVSELNEVIPLSQSALSQQLARLRAQGLVETRRESQTIYYSLAPGPADQVIHLLQNIYCPGDGSRPLRQARR